MSYPLRENLEIVDGTDSAWIRCGKCQFQYCRANQDWREFCKIRLLPPANAGSLIAILDGDYLLRQFYCPSCAALLDTDFVEKKQAVAGRA
jgi:acetone carboxylase gamma subunit